LNPAARRKMSGDRTVALPGGMTQGATAADHSPASLDLSGPLTR
jgi:hypothetical protein